MVWNRMRASRLSGSLALGLALALSSASACQRSSAGGAPTAASAVTHPETSSSGPAALAARLCANRPGCALRKVESLSNQGQLMELALPRPASKEECDGAEYWVIRGSTQQLLARDCDAQDGADARAHARVRVEAPQIIVDYEEGLSSDLCAGTNARLSEVDFHLVEERRWGGTGRLGSCTRAAELSADWATQKHTARWSSRACSGRPLNDAHTGDAIPSYQVAGVSEQTRLGTCAATIGQVVTAAGASPSSARVRAAVVNAALLVEVSGLTEGELSVHVASHSPDDGFMGSVGCGTADEYRLSTSTIDLKSGRVKTSGKQAPQLTVNGRDDSGVRLYAAALNGIGRLAISLRGSQGEHLDSALLSAHPSAAELPPLGVWFESKEPCELRSGRLELRTSSGPEPILRLSGS